MWEGLEFGWNPRVDGELLRAHPRDLAPRPQPFITGHTARETTLILHPTPNVKEYLHLSSVRQLYISYYFTRNFTKCQDIIK